MEEKMTNSEATPPARSRRVRVYARYTHNVCEHARFVGVQQWLCCPPPQFEPAWCVQCVCRSVCVDRRWRVVPKILPLEVPCTGAIPLLHSSSGTPNRTPPKTPPTCRNATFNQPMCV
eukprot:GDKI01028751.1.p1 GENE.GDKI01028751.1~~GDKI01028751.1.p1  ORF type:complete len:118 (-),score=17.49 GDKI01028751.1:174-527(-)